MTGRKQDEPEGRHVEAPYGWDIVHASNGYVVANVASKSLAEKEVQRIARASGLAIEMRPASAPEPPAIVSGHGS